jgi:hypothetical protein
MISLIKFPKKLAIIICCKNRRFKVKEEHSLNEENNAIFKTEKVFPCKGLG